MTMHSAYVFLVAAIAAEVVATTALANTNGFTRLWPSLIAVVGYALAFLLLSFVLRLMPTGVVYAVWSGMGIVFVTAIAWTWYGQRLDSAAVLGLSLILAGVLIINLFSDSTLH